MPTRCLNFDTLPTYDSHCYCVVTHLSLSYYSNTEYVKNKSPKRSKHSHSNLEHEEHEEHTQTSEKLQEVEPKNNIQHKPNPWADRPTRKTEEKRRKENKIKTRYFKPNNMNLAQIKFFSNLEHKQSWPIDVGLSPPHSVTHYTPKPPVCPKITSKHHKFSDWVNWSNTQHTKNRGLSFHLSDAGV